MDPAKRKKQGKHYRQQATAVLNAKRRAERLATALTPKTDAELIADFLAKKKPTVLPPGRADNVFSSTVVAANSFIKSKK